MTERSLNSKKLAAGAVLILPEVILFCISLLCITLFLFSQNTFRVRVLLLIPGWQAFCAVILVGTGIPRRQKLYRRYLSVYQTYGKIPPVSQYQRTFCGFSARAAACIGADKRRTEEKLPISTLQIKGSGGSND